jgi:hypothetical protein
MQCRWVHHGLWTVTFGHHEDRTPTHGYAVTREAAMTERVKASGYETDNVCRTIKDSQKRWACFALLHEPVGRDRGPFPGDGIDHFVMAITSAEAMARHHPQCMPMTVLICGSPAEGFQIVGLFAERGDAESYAEDRSLKDWWIARLVSPEAFAESQRRLLGELRAASRSRVGDGG